MKKLIYILLFIISGTAYSMRQDKIVAREFSKVDTIKFDFDGNQIEKTIVALTPTTMSKGKAETFFRKNGKAITTKMLGLIDLTLKLVYANDKAEYYEEGVPVGLNKDLYCLLAHQGSKFIYKAETESIYLERDLGGDKNKWYFTLLAQVSSCTAVPAQGICDPLTVQMHHDRGNVHDKVWVSELQSFFSKSALPRIQTIDGQRFVEKTACPDDKSYLEVKDYDEMVRTVASFFIESDSRYKKLK